MKKLTQEELNEKFLNIVPSPKESGVLKLIVCRPSHEMRQIQSQAEITINDGLIGDYWKDRHKSESKIDTRSQITLMNSKIIEMISGEKNNWPPAGDQLFVDLDLSIENLPIGQKIAIGNENNVILEVSDKPHTGCAKFVSRFGKDATLFINASERKHLRLRGINTRVLKSGLIKEGDIVKKI